MKLTNILVDGLRPHSCMGRGKGEVMKEIALTSILCCGCEDVEVPSPCTLQTREVDLICVILHPSLAMAYYAASPHSNSIAMFILFVFTLLHKSGCFWSFHRHARKRIASLLEDGDLCSSQKLYVVEWNCNDLCRLLVEVAILHVSEF